MTPGGSTSLPDFVPPMLATLGRPFDSDEHLYEIKWDGLRCLAFVDDDGWRLRSRRDREMTPRYPELAFLEQVPTGTLLDGELVVLADGRPDFSSALSREQARDPHRIAHLAATLPVTYVVFDVLYAGFASIMGEPLAARRERLATLLEPVQDEHLVLSDGVHGAGTELFAQTVERGMEGVVAKRLASPYQPGKRTDAWIKFKARQEIQCVILGYLAEDGDLRSLALAAPDLQGALTYVGRVGSGLGTKLRDDLLRRLESRPRSEPLVPCSEPAHWVEPGLFCTVSFTERTKTGMLRAPVFVALIDDD